jgi:hypothetical protein
MSVCVRLFQSDSLPLEADISEEEEEEEEDDDDDDEE